MLSFITDIYFIISCDLILFMKATLIKSPAKNSAHPIFFPFALKTVESGVLDMKNILAGELKYSPLYHYIYSRGSRCGFSRVTVMATLILGPSCPNTTLWYHDHFGLIGRAFGPPTAPNLPLAVYAEQIMLSNLSNSWLPDFHLLCDVPVLFIFKYPAYWDKIDPISSDSGEYMSSPAKIFFISRTPDSTVLRANGKIWGERYFLQDTVIQRCFASPWKSLITRTIIVILFIMHFNYSCHVSKNS